MENQINFPSDNIKGDKVSLADKTTENNLFLNVAATFNHPQLRPLHEYLNLYLEVPDDYASTLPLHTHLYTKNNSVAKKQVEEFLSYADLGITDFKVTEGKSSYLPDIEFGHRNSESNKKTYFDIYEESAGTRRLFNMLGPVLIGLHYGGIIFLDEIQSSLHPLLSHKLLELFNNPEKNKKNAQLIFTTHDTTLMDKDFMRRDQIWFVEKDAAGASHLYPLLDYSPKQNESLSKGYLEGRYGAIPVFGEWNM